MTRSVSGIGWRSRVFPEDIGDSPFEINTFPPEAVAVFVARIGVGEDCADTHNLYSGITRLILSYLNSAKIARVQLAHPPNAYLRTYQILILGGNLSHAPFPAHDPEHVGTRSVSHVWRRDSESMAADRIRESRRNDRRLGRVSLL